MEIYQSKYTGSQIDQILGKAQTLDNLKTSVSDFRILATDGTNWFLLRAGDNITIDKTGIHAVGGGEIPELFNFELGTESSGGDNQDISLTEIPEGQSKGYIHFIEYPYDCGGHTVYITLPSNYSYTHNDNLDSDKPVDHYLSGKNLYFNLYNDPFDGFSPGDPGPNIEVNFNRSGNNVTIDCITI